MAEKKTIVLAWVVEDFQVVGERRTDLGERPKLREVFVPKAAIWLKRGTEEDVRKATVYADRETDYKIAVLSYPTGERDPLGRAKTDVMKLAGKK